MATWSGDGKEVPAEVRDALAAAGPLPEGPADAHVHVRAGIGSLLGDTHLILSEGRLRVVGRKTSLDPLAEVTVLGRPHLDDSGYRPVLVLATPEGEQRLEVTALEEPAVEDLLVELPAAPAVEEDAPPPNEPAVRAAFVGLLVRRVKQRRAEIVARRHARQTASLDRARGTQREGERWRARHGRKPVRRPPGDAITTGGALQNPLLRFFLLALLGAAVFGVFAVLGRVASGRP